MEKKIKHTNWGGFREESKVIEQIHDQWCTDNGYPIRKRRIYKGKWRERKNDTTTTF